MDGAAQPHEFSYIDEAGFNLSKTRQRGRNIIDHQPHFRMPLLQAMEQACGDIDLGSIYGWIRHTRQYIPRCLAGENIGCDVDEILWPDPNRRQGP
jgi:hypothetical protein